MREVLLLASVVLLAFLSFGLGRLSATDARPEVALCEATLVPIRESARTSTAVPGGTLDAPLYAGTYVGSRHGSTYHFPWCPGAKRINKENEVWFNSKQQAEDAGYRAASNCKGL